MELADLITDHAPPKLITPHDRFEALLAAALNEDRAMLCTKDQPALRTVFEMNAKLFRRIAE